MTNPLLLDILATRHYTGLTTFYLQDFYVLTSKSVVQTSESMNIILYAIPFFFLLIGIELIAEKVRGTDYYRVNDAINSLTMGVLSRMTGIMKNLIPLTLYVLCYEHIRIVTLPDTWFVWVLAFVLYDFCYYWNHRMGHEMSLLWAAHVVHHSSEEYNLTTALRQTSGSIFSWVFYLPLAILGFDPLMIVSVGALNLVYQFWVHTRHVPKLGWFEWFFVSPSNHRVHHGQNQLYLDKNYGGVFILWDRLFGTFQEELESEPPIYGVRKALKSWNPVWGNVQVYWQLIQDSWHTKRWTDKFRVWFGRTGWRPEDVSRDYPLERVDLSRFEKFDITISLPTKLYCLLQHSVTVLIGVVFMMSAAKMAFSEQIGLACFVIFSCMMVGLVMEKRPVAIWVEWAKNLALIVTALRLPMEHWLSMSLLVGTGTSLVLLWFVSKDILRPAQEQQPQQAL